MTERKTLLLARFALDRACTCSELKKSMMSLDYVV